MMESKYGKLLDAVESIFVVNKSKAYEPVVLSASCLLMVRNTLKKLSNSNKLILSCLILSYLDGVNVVHSWVSTPESTLLQDSIKHIVYVIYIYLGAVFTHLYYIKINIWLFIIVYVCYIKINWAFKIYEQAKGSLLFDLFNQSHSQLINYLASHLEAVENYLRSNSYPAITLIWG